MGDVLSVEAGIPRVEPKRAIHYGVFFRDCDGKLQVAIDSLCAERRRAEMFIDLRKAEGVKIDYFVVTLSVPASAEEQANA